MLAFAQAVASTVGFYLCLDKGTRRMLYAKARERVTETSEFAELSMKAAIAARQFALFDPDGNARIDLVDIARALSQA